MARAGGRWLWSAWSLDVALALVVAALQVSTLWLVPAGHPAAPDFRGPDATAVLLALATSLPLVARRRVPGLVLAIVGLSAVAQAAVGIPAQGYGLIVALYSVAVYAARRESLVALAIFSFFTAVSLVLADAVQYAGANALVFLTAWVLGDQRRTRRARMTALAERTAQLERERADRARLAALSERARLAAEMQDVVAHGLTAMLAQARGADRLLDRDPVRAGVALEAVEATGRQSLSELRRLLGLLRGREGALLEPQPGLDDVGELVNRFRAAGLDAFYTVEGRPRPLPRVAELSAYRIVQEVLTAALDEPGHGTVAVTVRFTDSGLDVEVVGPGLGVTAQPGAALAGSRERVALLGGALESAPVDGAYRVTAHLPLGRPA